MEVTKLERVGQVKLVQHHTYASHNYALFHMIIVMEMTPLPLFLFFNFCGGNH